MTTLGTMKVRCTEIQWDFSDTEGKLPKLPKQITVEVPTLRENEDSDELADELADAIHDKTGCRVLGFNHKIVG